MKADALASRGRRRLPLGLLMVAAFIVFSLVQFYMLYRLLTSSDSEGHPANCNNDKSVDELREIDGRLETLKNRTRFDLALESPNPPTIYTCGDNSKEYFEVIGLIFEEYETNGKVLDQSPWYGINGVRGLNKVESTEYDLFVTTYQIQCSSDATTWLTNRFKGQVSSVSRDRFSLEGLSQHMLNTRRVWGFSLSTCLERVRTIRSKSDRSPTETPSITYLVRLMPKLSSTIRSPTCKLLG